MKHTLIRTPSFWRTWQKLRKLDHGLRAASQASFWLAIAPRRGYSQAPPHTTYLAARLESELEIDARLSSKNTSKPKRHTQVI